MAGRTAASVALAMILAEGAAHAGAEEREVCASAAEHAQQLRDEGKYRRAREQMLVCARDVCPPYVRSDCGRWLGDLDRDAPTVVFGARDGGKDVADVKVSIDGAVVAERLDGKPLLVDAGEHTFKFERGRAVKEERVLVRAAEKARPIVVVFGETPAPRTADKPSFSSAKSAEQGSLVPAMIVGGIGVAALIPWAIFGLQGMNDLDALNDCKPRCATDDVDKARSKLIIADISLGVSVVALAVATAMVLTRPKTETKTQTGKNTLRWTAGGGPGTAGVGLGVSF